MAERPPKNAASARLADAAFWLDTSSRVRAGLILLQVIAPLALTLALSLNDADAWDSPWNPLTRNAAWAIALSCFALIIFESIFVLFFKQQYGRNYLVCYAKGGQLYSEDTKSIQVALRRDTVQALLKQILSSRANDRGPKGLHSVGRRIGNEFAHAIAPHAIAGSTLSRNQVLETLLEYDQSSGLGAFSLLKRPPTDSETISMTIAVTNPFTGLGRECKFLEGYFAGICEDIWEVDFSATSERSANGDNVLSISLTSIAPTSAPRPRSTKRRR